MEGSKARLSQGIVAAYGPYLSKANRDNLDRWIAYSGSSARFRICARNQAVIFASKVASANKYVDQFSLMLKALKRVPGSKTVSGYFALYQKSAVFSVTTVLQSQAQNTIAQIGGCSS